MRLAAHLDCNKGSIWPGIWHQMIGSKGHVLYVAQMTIVLLCADLATCRSTLSQIIMPCTFWRQMHVVSALMYTHHRGHDLYATEFSFSMPSGLTKPLLRAGLNPSKLSLD